MQVGAASFFTFDSQASRRWRLARRRRPGSIPAGATRATSSSGATRCPPRGGHGCGGPAGTSRPAAAAAGQTGVSAARRGIGRDCPNKGKGKRGSCRGGSSSARRRRAQDGGRRRRQRAGATRAATGGDPNRNSGGRYRRLLDASSEGGVILKHSVNTRYRGPRSATTVSGRSSVDQSRGTPRLARVDDRVVVGRRVTIQMAAGMPSLSRPLYFIARGGPPLSSMLMRPTAPSCSARPSPRRRARCRVGLAGRACRYKSR